MAGFFTDVPERIEFGGLGSTEPFTYKVYQPDRLVMGKPMEEHLRIAVCFWHSFNWPGSDVFGVGTFDRPWLSPGADPMEAARAKLDAAFEFVAKLGVPFFTFHDRDVAPEGRTFAETIAQPGGGRRRDRGPHGAHGHPAPVGNRQPLQPPALRGRRGNESRPGGLRLRRGAGEAHARGDASARRCQLRPVGRSRGLRDAPQHRPRPRGAAARAIPDPGRRAQAPHRLHRNAPPRAQAAGADQAPVRLRLGNGRLVPRPPRPRRCVPGQHRGQPRDAGRPQLRARGGRRHRSRDLRQHRHESWRPAERMGHRPVPQLGGRAGAGDARDPARRWLHDRRLQLRREATAAELDRSDLFHAHIGGIDTLARALLVAADLLEAGELSGEKDRRYAGWAQGLGAEMLTGGLSLADIEAKVAGDGIEPRPRSGGQERLENVVNQRIWSTDRDR